MCELFGVSSRIEADYHEILREFFSHGRDNPHGWGMVSYDGKDQVRLKKEPVSAIKSSFLKELLDTPVVAGILLAHVRLATKGGLDYKNTHPFVKRDRSGRIWTLEHNGTVFESEVLSSYMHKQEGDTDSERILYYLIDQMDAQIGKKGGALTEMERAKIIEEMICKVAPENKINLILSDGELLYVHTNYKKSLHQRREEERICFSTRPLSEGEWEELPLNQLLVFRGTELLYRGKRHDYEFFDDPEKMKYLYLDFASI